MAETPGPRIGVTLGEAVGIGPEVIVEALATLPPDVSATVYSQAAVWEVARERLAGSVRPRVRFVAVASSGGERLPGHSDAQSRFDAFVALEALADAAVAGDIDAMLTGPVPKAIFIHLPAPPAGQTEYLAARLGARRFAMMLAGPRLRVVPVTTHLPLRRVADVLTTEAIFEASMAAEADLRAVFGMAAPRLGICGLNPHAGEGGRFGDEEARLIAPAIAALRAAGVDAVGPLAADTAFRAGYLGEFDAIVAMYHDQALGPLKTVHFADAVNFTCGLPVPRVSPDHGTAYDRAGQGSADPQSAIAALALACRAARARQRAEAAA